MAALSALLGGCVSLLPNQDKPPIIVPFRAANNIVKSQVQSPFSVSIGMPNMPRAMSGNQITLEQSDGTIAYIDEVNFSAPANLSIQNVILETFDKAATFRASVRANSNARADFELALDVNSFQVTMPSRTQAGVAKIEVTARLVNVNNRRPLATKIFTAQAPAVRGEPSMPALALETATQDLALQIMEWTQSTGRAFFNNGVAGN